MLYAYINDLMGCLHASDIVVLISVNKSILNPVQIIFFVHMCFSMVE